ncbi:BTAD domain-containing putative transcriptional regulator [Trujillonella humicola]|uniref:BTAD domain-containing putative transcriptional regulator n=1 Tax=Trujillonella humicola TaxID=3383699 RepID=UPI003906A424
MSGAERLRISLLGQLAATCDGEPLDLGGPRQRAVLAVLLLARGETVPAGRLAASVWPDRPPVDTPAALQSYVSHLRRRLEPGSAARARSAVIVRERPGYAVRLPADAVDAWRFEQLLQEAAGASALAAVPLLEEALGLWHGPALAEYADAGWAQPEIARLTDLRATAREQLAAARLELGGAGILVPDLEALVAEEPLREERWRLLALALYRVGRQADALAALRRARAVLAEELGVDPGPALRALEDDVLAQSPALGPPARAAFGAAAPTPAAPTPAPPAPAPRPAPDDVPRSAPPGAEELAERDRELAAIRAALDDLADGRPGVLLVEGPAGIGKSRLLAEARRLAAERSIRVLAARGSPLERSFGFGAVRQLFEPELADAGRREELLARAAAPAGAVFDLAPGECPDGSFAVLHGLYWLAVNLAATGPLVLALDDLQWCDDASLRALTYLVRRMDAVPVLVAGTVRTGEQAGEDALLAELALDPATTVLRPAPLSPEGIGALIEQRLPGPVSPLFARAVERTTSGNPLLLRQLLRGLEVEGVRPDAAHADTVVAIGSRAVSSMVVLRLRRLPEEVRAVARAAAVLGDGAPLPVLAALAGTSEERTAAALAVLARVEVVTDEDPPAFVHPLVRDAVHHDLPAAERGLRHEEAARLLAATGAGDEQVAAHLLLAPPRGERMTVEVLRRAARGAADRGASDSAVTLLRRALAEPPPPDLRAAVLVELGAVESRVDGVGSIEHLQQALALLDDPRERAQLAVLVAHVQTFAAAPGVATAFAREARAAVPPELDDCRQALLALERTSGFMHGVDPATWRGPHRPEPSGDGDGSRMLAATVGFEAMLQGRDRGRAVALARAALDGDRLWEVDNGLLWVAAAVTRIVADDDIGDFWQRARAFAHRRGSVFAVHAVNLWEGFWRWRRGELDEALASLRVASDQGRIWGDGRIGNSYTCAFAVACHLDRGDPSAARRAADAGLAAPHPGEGGRLLEHAVARLLVAEGRFEEALAAVVRIPAPVPVPNPVWHPWRSTGALALAGLGRPAEAVTLVEEEVRRLREWGAPGPLGAGLSLLGRLRGAAALPDLRAAVGLLETTTATVDLARARCALASRPELPDEEARPLLRAAAEGAAATGAAGLADRVRAALAARGLPDETPAECHRVSATERRILDLAATGLGAREIAERLFLEPGTVHGVLEAADGSRLRFFSSPPADRGTALTGGDR